MLKSMLIGFGLSLYCPGFAIGAEVAESFQFPVDGYLNFITRPFGAINSLYNNKLHTGEDISGDAGITQVVATANGKVMFSQTWKKCPNWGHVLVIEHMLPDGRRVNSVYGHLDASSVEVVEGDDVMIGQPLGKIGNYGCWSDHLHFSIRLGNFGSSVSKYPSWLLGYLAKENFPENYCIPSVFIDSGICFPTITFIPTRSELNSNDLIDWGGLGPAGTLVPTPFTHSSLGGLSIEVSKPTPQDFLRLDQCTPPFDQTTCDQTPSPQIPVPLGWGGTFTPGDRVLFTGNIGLDEGPVSISFSTPIQGAGLQIEPEVAVNNYQAFIRAFDDTGRIIGDFTGIRIDPHQALFLGVKANDAVITRIEVGVSFTGSLFTSFTINQVDIVR